MFFFNRIKPASETHNSYKRIAMLLPTTASEITKQILQPLNSSLMVDSLGAYKMSHEGCDSSDHLVALML